LTPQASLMTLRQSVKMQRVCSIVRLSHEKIPLPSTLLLS
jgi:hypothetical protein